MALIVAVLVISCFGLAFATASQDGYGSGSMGGGMMRYDWGNVTNRTGQPRFWGNESNETKPEWLGMPPRFEGNGSNGTAPTGFGRNADNGTFNETALQDFDNAVLAGDYTSALQLHGTYGFGGPIFDRLNSTTFAKLSQIQNLQHELAKELGLNNTGTNSAGLGLGMNFLPGPMENEGFSRGRMRNVAYHQTPTAVPDN